MKSSWSSSLRVQLIVPVLAAVLPMLALAIGIAQWEKRRVGQEVTANAQQLMRAYAQQLEQSIASTHDLLVAISHLRVRPAQDKKVWEPYFQRLVRQYPQYANLGALSARGEASVTAVPLPHQLDPSELLWFDRLTKPSVADFQLVNLASTASLTIAEPVASTDSASHTVVFASLKLEWLNLQLARIPLPPGAVVTVINPSGIILGRNPEVEKWFGRAAVTGTEAKTVLAKGEGVTELTGADGVARVCAFGPVRVFGETPLYVSVGIPAAALMSEINMKLVFWLCLLVAIAGLGGFLTWRLVSRRILQPMNNLIRTTRRLASGDLAARVGLTSPAGEIRALAQQLDEMAGSIEGLVAKNRRTADNLRQQQMEFVSTQTAEQQWQDAINAVGDAISIEDLDGKILRCNAAMADFLGKNVDEIVGHTCYELVHAGSDQSDECPIMRMRESHHRESMVFYKDGRWLEVFADPCFNSKGELRGAVHIVADVTDRKAAEDRMKEQLKRLR